MNGLRKAAWLRTTNSKRDRLAEEVSKNNLEFARKLQLMLDCAAAAKHAECEAAQLKEQRQSKGYKMLRAAGWTPGEGLGARGEGTTKPIPTRMVTGRPGIERHLAQPARVTHLAHGSLKPKEERKGRAGGEEQTKKAEGTRGERRAARRAKAAVEKKERARLAEALSLGTPEGEGNTGPLWRRKEGHG